MFLNFVVHHINSLNIICVAGQFCVINKMHHYTFIIVFYYVLNAHWFEKDVSFLMRSSKGLGSIYLQKLKIIITSEFSIVES